MGKLRNYIRVKKENDVPEEVTETVEVEETKEEKMGFFGRHKKGIIAGSIIAALIGGAVIASKKSDNDYDDEEDDDLDDDVIDEDIDSEDDDQDTTEN